ncbi:MAG: hypothetical protein ACLFML_01500 [Desulfobacterales bacterium]
MNPRLQGAGLRAEYMIDCGRIIVIINTNDEFCEIKEQGEGENAHI